jgi:hypothetical protein
MLKRRVVFFTRLLRLVMETLTVCFSTSASCLLFALLWQMAERNFCRERDFSYANGGYYVLAVVGTFRKAGAGQREVMGLCWFFFLC